MARVGSANTYQYVVLRCEVEGHVALAFTSVPATDDDVHKTLTQSRKQTERRCATHLNVVGCRALGVDDLVGFGLQDTDVRLGGIRRHLLVRPQLGHRRGRAAVLVSSVEHLTRGT